MPVKKTVKKAVASKAKPKSSKIYYYRIFCDDNEKKNYLKSGLTHKQVEKYLKGENRTDRCPSYVLPGENCDRDCRDCCCR